MCVCVCVYVCVRVRIPDETSRHEEFKIREKNTRGVHINAPADVTDVFGYCQCCDMP